MTRAIVVVGGGQAAAAFAAKLRAHGLMHPVILIGEEPVLPYQKPPLSKKYLTGEMAFDRLLLRPEAWYAANGVELRIGRRAVAFDPIARLVTLSDGERIPYATLALATGAVPLRLSAAVGGDLAGVFAMRDKADADRLAGAFRPGRRLVVIGGGYVGLEAAAVARLAGLDVTVIERAPRILQRVAAPATAALVRALHVSHGVTVIEGATVERIDGETGAVAGVRLADGRRLAADIVIVGIGIRPADDLARDAGLALDNGIAVDEFGRTSDPDVYAFGDCASFVRHGRRIRLESVQNAIDQAEAAAAHVAGEPVPYDPKPWFWSDQYDAKLQIAGLNTGHDATLLQDGPRPGSHAVWYFRDGALIAVDALNYPAAFAAAKKLFESGRSVSRDDIESRPLRELVR